MVNVQWAKEIADFKGKLSSHVTNALASFIASAEEDSGDEYWNDEFGMDAKAAFASFIDYLQGWVEGDVVITGLGLFDDE